MRITSALLIALCISILGGCSMAESRKLVVYEEGSINMHPLPYPVQAITTEAGETVYSYVMPDGSHMAVEDMGVYGNFTLTTNQNDNTEQTSRGQVDAEVSPTLTGQGEATGGAKTKTTGDLGDTTTEIPENTETTE